MVWEVAIIDTTIKDEEDYKKKQCERWHSDSMNTLKPAHEANLSEHSLQDLTNTVDPVLKLINEYEPVQSTTHQSINFSVKLPRLYWLSVQSEGQLLLEYIALSCVQWPFPSYLCIV